MSEIATRPALTSRGLVLLRQLPRPTVYSTAELILLLLIAVQVARLFWISAAPIGPVGDWRPESRLVAPGDAVFANFDPFFRLQAGSGRAVVTSLNLKLHGIREDRASGRGAAIIALPDGRQLSLAVGEEIIPGVVLAAVGFDNVTISRNGAMEQIFLDQSPAAETGGALPAAPPAVPPPTPSQQQAPPIVTPPQPIGQAIGLTARTAGGRVTGMIVSPGGDGGQAFRAAGFAPGDVIVAINGQRVGSMEQARAAMSGGEINVTVDRGGRAIPMRVRLNR